MNTTTMESRQAAQREAALIASRHGDDEDWDDEKIQRFAAAFGAEHPKGLKALIAGREIIDASKRVKAGHGLPESLAGAMASSYPRVAAYIRSNPAQRASQPTAEASASAPATPAASAAKMFSHYNSASTLPAAAASPPPTAAAIENPSAVLAQVQSLLAHASAPRDPVKEWNGIVAGNVAAGMKHTQAMSKATREHPVLHGEYLAAVNKRRPATHAGKASAGDVKLHAAKPSTGPRGAEAITAFNAAVDANMAGGKMNRANAVRQIAHKHPDLMSAYSEAEAQRLLQVQRDRIARGQA